MTGIIACLRSFDCKRSAVPAHMKYLLWCAFFAAASLVSAQAQTAPTIASITNSQSLNQGQSLTLSVSVNGTAPFTYVWKKDSTVLTNATTNIFTIPSLGISDAGTYTVTVTNSAGSITSSAILIDVIPAVAPSIYYTSSATNITVGNTLNLSVYAFGSEPMEFVWKRDGVEVARTSHSSFSKSNAQTSDSGSYTVTITNAAGSVTSSAITVTVSPLTAPQITNHPRDTAVESGDYIWLSASVSDYSGVSFQWYKDNVAISGATSSSYSKSNAQATDAGSYTVKATNSAGSTTSNAAAVTIKPPVAPTNATISPSNLTVTASESLNLYVSVQGSSPLGFQWKKDGVNIPNTTSNNYWKSNITADDAGSYSVVVSNSAGSTTSNSVNVSVSNTPATIITYHPQSIAVYPGMDASFNVSVSGNESRTYQWKKDGVPISNSNSSYYYIPNGAAASDAGVYTVEVTTAQGTISSRPATLTVLPAVAPTIIRSSSSQTVVQGQSFELSVDMTGYPSPTIQWYKDGVAIEGANSYYYYKSEAAASDGGVYTVKVSNAAGSITSSGATISVIPAPAPVIFTHPSSASLLAGQSFYLSVDYGYLSGTDVQWYLDDVAIPGANSSNYYISSAQPRHAGTYKAVLTNAGGSATSREAVITVDLSASRPVIVFTSGSRTIPGGNWAGVNIELRPGLTGYTIAWKKDGTVIPNATNTYLDISNFSDTHVGTYIAEVTHGGTTYTSRPAKLELLESGQSPRIRRHPASFNVYVNDYVSLYVEADGERPFTYQWRKDGTDIPNATNEGYYLSSALAAHTGNYSVVVKNRHGEVTSDVATLTVNNPGAGSPPIILRHPPSRTVSAGIDWLGLGVDVLGNSSGLTYQWYKDDVAVPGATSSYHYFANGSITSAHAGRYKVVVTNAAGSTTSEEAIVTVVSRGTGPTFTTQPSNQSAFVGGSVTFTAAATGGSVTYQWRKNGANISGATSSKLTLDNLSAPDAGNYTVVATNADGTASSAVATLTVNAATKPEFTKHPSSTNALFGGSVTFSATAAGSPAPTYQWLRNGSAISGATSSSLALNNLQASDAGTYSVVATNSAGSATSQGAVLQLFNTLPKPASITSHPQSIKRSLGSSATFTVGVDGTAPLTVQWYKDNVAIPGATDTTLTIPLVTAQSPGSYHAVATNDYGSASSHAASLTIGTSAVAKVYFGTFSTGENWALQINQDGSAIFLGYIQSTNQIIFSRDVQIANGGFSFGQSTAASITTDANGITRQAHALTAGLDSRYFSGRVTGQISGNSITGQISSLNMSLSGSERTGAMSSVAGSYDAVPVGTGVGEIHAIAAPDGALLLVEIDANGVRGGVGTVNQSGAFNVSAAQYAYSGNVSTATSSLSGTYTPPGGTPVTLAPIPLAGTGAERLAAVSTRSLAGSGENTLIAGFVISGNSKKDVLVRAVGPTLSTLGVSGVLANPRLQIFKGSNVIHENDDWSANGHGPAVSEAAARLGASALPNGSADAALLANLDPGVYTAHVSTTGGATGITLLEVYDASAASAAASKVLALSTRGLVRTGDDILIVGFVVEGAVPKKVLVRGVGPGIAATVSGALANPRLRLFKGNTLMAENDNWSSGANADQLAEAAEITGARPLADGSNDAALLLYLAPGVYTAHINGVGDTTGVALAEIYEVP